MRKIIALTAEQEWIDEEMADLCTDGRFELIEKYRKKLIDSTNIETAQDEMAVLDSILFRIWQMGWLDKLEQPERKTGKWEERGVSTEKAIDEWQSARCSACGLYHTTPYLYYFRDYNYCPNCGARMVTKNEM